APLPFQILRSRGTAVGAPRQRRKDFLCAGFLPAGIGGAACEYLADAARVLRTRGSEGSLNPQKPDGRVILQLGDAVVLERSSLVVPDQVQAGPVVRGKERG